MSRPAQLEQQIERMKELQAEMLGGDNQGKPPVTPPAAPDTPVTPPAEPVVAPVSDEPPATVSKDEYNKLEQRYRTLQGMHTADVNRLRNELQGATAAIESLEDRVIAAEKQASKASAAPAKYVTAEDEKEYGDTLEMVRRAAREEVEADAAKREERYLALITELQEQLGHVQNKVVPTVESLTRAQADQGKAEFWGAINTQVPDWKAINDNQGFKDWLLSEDPITGATRQQFLSQARQEYNAPKVIRFFQEWKRLSAGGQTPAPKNPQADLERLVAPGASKGTGPVTSQDKKQWTSADVSQFYKDVATGKYADKLDERKKIEADIFLAQKEGRYTRV
jgi:hypothetical protein